MNNVEVILNGIELVIPHVGSTQEPIENTSDVVALSGQLHTYFISLRQGWTFQWSIIHENDYLVIRDIYESQFSSPFEYPILTIERFNTFNEPVRMTINARDLRQNGCWIEGFEITLTHASPIIRGQGAGEIASS